MAQFVESHADAVYRYVYQRLDRTHDVDDLVQEIFLAAWRALGTFRGECELQTWLLGVARHKIGDYYRETFRNLALEDEIDEASPPEGLTFEIDFASEIDGRKLEARTRQVLSALPDRYRSVLLWRYWDQRSVREMAERSGKTPKSVERLLARARHEFRRRWSDV